MDKKFFFDQNIFDAPPPEEPEIDLPPPPPTFSEEEMSVARDMYFEKGRQKGVQEQTESREQYVAASLEIIAQNFSQLFAAETMREIVFEKEALRLSVAVLDQLFPLLNEKIGSEEVRRMIEQTLIAHRKRKEIVIQVPAGMKAEIDIFIGRLREEDQEKAFWRVVEIDDMAPGNFVLEWADGGAVRDSLRAAADIRRHMTELFGAPIPPAPAIEAAPEASISEIGASDVLSDKDDESGAVRISEAPSSTESDQDE